MYIIINGQTATETWRVGYYNEAIPRQHEWIRLRGETQFADYRVHTVIHDVNQDTVDVHVEENSVHPRDLHWELLGEKRT